MQTSSLQTGLRHSRHAAPAPRFAPGADDAEDGSRKPPAKAVGELENGELPYRVELWDENKAGVEQVLAVTANSSIGYAAFFEATREHPLRYVTLRHKGSVLSRWNGPASTGH